MYQYICCHINIYIYTETKLMENDNFHLSAANGQRSDKLPFVFCKRKTLIDICHFSKHANLCFTRIEGTNIFLKHLLRKNHCVLTTCGL
jgi:hypothetical protein